MKVLNNYVLIVPTKGEQTTDSGLIIPDVGSKKFGRGFVRYDSNNFRAGDEVLFISKFGFDDDASEITINGEKVIPLKEEQIVVVWRHS